MQFEENVPLAAYSNLKIGGPARYFKVIRNKKELIESLYLAEEMDLRVFVLGGGTNILWSDRGYDGLVLKPEMDFIVRNGNELTVGAAVPMKDIVGFSVKAGLAGLDWAGGLPGTLGGAIFGNAGCFGGEMKDSVAEVESVDLKSAESKRRNNQECGFGYRDSVFKSGGISEIIVQATLRLEEGNADDLTRRVADEEKYREEHQPLDKPNIGSFFKNVRVEGLPRVQVDPYRHTLKTDPFPVIPAAYLINEAGLKGAACGGAVVSSKHPNFLVNNGGATTADFIALIEQVKKEVKSRTGIELEEEVRVIK
ncbi:MAG: UDP-N-acetylmuramate dehydrogenase [Candidatus Colwellbacteria bacterium]|nr:UDP-N-acetylmuramate dehydrogenase [Candidatus Colwellbacteria bacterium]